LPSPPISELGRRLRAGEITSVALAELFLKRLETFGPPLNAVAQLTRERALTEARLADEELQSGKDRGPLHGIPYGAKDLFSTKGIPTTWGAEPFRGRIIDEDATAVVRLRAAGAVLVAKLAMVEIAGGMGYRQANASWTGPALNPWNTDFWAGGSSSGSGASVGAGLVPFALGTETWGSILCPASFCGVAGLRPTYGRVSRQGAMALSWSMDKVGALTRSAEDCGLVLSALAGPDPLDESASDREFVFPEPGSVAKPKLAVIKGCHDSVHPDVKRCFLESLDVLRRFATIEELEMPDDLPWNTVPATIIDCEIASAFEGMIESGAIWELTAPEDRFGAHSGQLIPAVDYINALRIRRNVMQPRMDALVKPFDAIITPSRSTPAYHAVKPFRDTSRGYSVSDFDAAANCCGLPALTVPNGFGEDGLPSGLLFSGRAFSESRLLAIGMEFQNRTDWHRRVPELNPLD
jgi:aspartyl-tRNA(Asn)/glutamyl-tRNA(Gln) amidotransferase subunit A